MKSMKSVSNYVKSLVISLILLTPTIAMAASPKGQVKSVIDSVLELLLYLAPSLGGLALVFYGVQYYFAGESHTKADLKGNMKATCWVTVLIFIAVGTIKWIASSAS